MIDIGELRPGPCKFLDVRRNELAALRFGSQGGGLLLPSHAEGELGQHLAKAFPLNLFPLTGNDHRQCDILSHRQIGHQTKLLMNGSDPLIESLINSYFLV